MGLRQQLDERADVPRHLALHGLARVLTSRRRQRRYAGLVGALYSPRGARVAGRGSGGESANALRATRARPAAEVLAVATVPPVDAQEASLSTSPTSPAGRSRHQRAQRVGELAPAPASIRRSTPAQQEAAPGAPPSMVALATLLLRARPWRPLAMNAASASPPPAPEVKPTP